SAVVLTLMTAGGGGNCSLTTFAAAFVLVGVGVVSGLVTVAVAGLAPPAPPLTMKGKFWLWPDGTGPTVTVCWWTICWPWTIPRPAVVVNVRVEPSAGSGLPLVFVTITVTVAVLFRGSGDGAVMVSWSVTFSNWKAPMSMAPM